MKNGTKRDMRPRGGGGSLINGMSESTINICCEKNSRKIGKFKMEKDKLSCILIFRTIDIKFYMEI